MVEVLLFGVTSYRMNWQSIFEIEGDSSTNLQKMVNFGVGFREEIIDRYNVTEVAMSCALVNFESCRVEDLETLEQFFEGRKSCRNVDVQYISRAEDCFGTKPAKHYRVCVKCSFYCFVKK